jgi:peptidoglycan/LPS O-acetylase OafA/YrhL
VAAAASAAAVLTVPWIHNATHASWLVNAFPLARWPEFVLGTALGVLVRSGTWRGPGLECSLAMTLIGYFLSSRLPGEYGYAAGTVLGFACLICAGAVADRDGLPSMWRRPGLVRLGEWSFAFYMVHLLVLRMSTVLFGVHPRFSTLPGLLVAASAFLVALGLAWALCAGVERPAQRLLTRWRPGRVPRPGERCEVPAQGPGGAPAPPERGGACDPIPPAREPVHGHAR